MGAVRRHDREGGRRNSQSSGSTTKRCSQSFSLFVRQADDVEEALRRNNIAMDVARARFIDLEQAAAPRQQGGAGSGRCAAPRRDRRPRQARPGSSCWHSWSASSAVPPRKRPAPPTASTERFEGVARERAGGDRQGLLLPVVSRTGRQRSPTPRTRVDDSDRRARRARRPSRSPPSRSRSTSMFPDTARRHVGEPGSNVRCARRQRVQRPRDAAETGRRSGANARKQQRAWLAAGHASTTAFDTFVGGTRRRRAQDAVDEGRAEAQGVRREGVQGDQGERARRVAAGAVRRHARTRSTFKFDQAAFADSTAGALADTGRDREGDPQTDPVAGPHHRAARQLFEVQQRRAGIFADLASQREQARQERARRGQGREARRGRRET